jgi:hypothetical protein
LPSTNLDAFMYTASRTLDCDERDGAGGGEKEKNQQGALKAGKVGGLGWRKKK